jgi:L-2-hydroxyglutarate oxidase LhgO
MEKVDITIIGASVIGLALAAEIARPDLSVFVLKKNHTHGGGISSRNSEVIHGGMYYPEDSLKASLCIAGNKMLYDLAAKNNISHRRTGKLIVAVKPEEIEELERQRRRPRIHQSCRIESPGMTASPAITRYVKEKYLGGSRV